MAADMLAVESRVRGTQQQDARSVDVDGVGNGKAIDCAPHGVGVAIMG